MNNSNQTVYAANMCCPSNLCFIVGEVCVYFCLLLVYHWRRNGNPLQCSFLENLMDRGTWWATYHKESDTTEQAHTYNKLSVNEYISNFLGKCPLGQ